MRALVRETRLHTDQLVYPVFVAEGLAAPRAIGSLAGQSQWTDDSLVGHLEPLVTKGLRAVLVFGLPARKDAEGSAAWDPEGVTPRVVRRLKEAFPGLCVMGDVCLCPATDHGHCGVLGPDGLPVNDATVALLVRSAVAQAAAGADFVAPSDMMDGRIAAIRAGLDSAGFPNTGILSYSAKFASSFYGPFRDAASSAPQQGDRQSHQIAPSQGREAVAQSLEDERQGADLLMVKPAMPALDIIAALRGASRLPIAAYQVSGEYAMIEAAANAGWLDRARAVRESLTAMARAGADVLITYYAAAILRGEIALDEE